MLNSRHETMNSYDRRNKIIDAVNENGSVLVSELSSSFEVSEVTIRADLRLLEEKGLLKRFHGGAGKDVPMLDTVNTDGEMVLEERFRHAEDPKRRIALAAVAMVKQGDTVILDSGSTTMLIAEELVKSGGITVITNNLPAAFVLLKTQTLRWWCVAGHYGIKRARYTAISPSMPCKGLWRISCLWGPMGWMPAVALPPLMKVTR